LAIHAYGLMIALGVIVSVWLTGRRLEQAGTGTSDQFNSVAVWAVVAGVIGARIYYIVTDASEPWRHPARWIKIWEGGLGIPGGLLLGSLVAVWAAKRKGLSVPHMLTAAAPAIPLAQAIGRIGNWWNQELYGRATTLPWGLRIDDAHLPGGAPSAQYPSGTLFHPTFLYESLWNLALCGLLILIDRKMKLRPGRLMAVYVVGYSIGRFWVESLRIDPANHGGGWRLNQWTALVAFVLSMGYLIIDWIRHRNDDPALEPVPDPALEPVLDPEPDLALDPEQAELADYVAEDE
jgi:prolipoprotein diacylglyceryl transferase